MPLLLHVRSAMALTVAAAWFWSSLPSVEAAAPRSLHSRSGQFIVRGLPVDPRPVGDAKSDVQYVRLDPSVMAVSCERIKLELLDHLALPDSWKGTVKVDIYPIRQDNERIQVTAVRFADGWGYQLDVPELVSRTRLIRAVVQVVLSEIANRRAREQAVELPLWLVEGLVARLEDLTGSTLTMTLDTRVVSRRSEDDQLATARALLRKNPPLTFEELSWPGDEYLDGEGAELYRRCAQVFTHELLRLNNGRACLGRMVANLGEAYNWQTVFMRSFQPHFPRLADVAKWWTLNAMHLSGHEPKSGFSMTAALDQLHQLLLTPAQVRLGTNELPREIHVGLQNVIQGWSGDRQLPVIRAKISQMQALRLRAPEELLPLVDGYLTTLAIYLDRRSKADMPPSRKNQSPPNMRLVVPETLRRLDALDRKRDAFRKQPLPPPAARE